MDKIKIKALGNYEVIINKLPYIIISGQEYEFDSEISNLLINSKFAIEIKNDKNTSKKTNKSS